MWWILALGALVLAWNLAPVLMLCTLPIPARHKLCGSLSLLRAAGRGLLVLPAALLAPLVVPIALLQTPRAANALPRWACWWDNDVSINGDGWAVLRAGQWVRVQGDELPGEVAVPYTDPAYAGDAYYAPGHHPRSFYARWVWLGLRNRASALAARLGYAVQPADLLDANTWGTDTTGRNHAGWCVRRNGPVYQLSIVRPIGAGLCLRVNTGHKLDLVRRWGRDVALVVNITASVLRFKGEDAHG
ncbi:MAG: hypothetical protein HYY98_17110 [Burkholderiales bacterium]|nr:hypothetical protein [Burkholderiales bacterium]